MIIRFRRACQKKRLDPLFCSLIGFPAIFFISRPGETRINHENTKAGRHETQDGFFRVFRPFRAFVVMFEKGAGRRVQGLED